MEESWTWWCAPVILAMVGSVKYEGLGPSWSGQKVRPYLQNNESREAGEMAQAIKCLPSKHEGWNSNSRTTKKKKKKKEKKHMFMMQTYICHPLNVWKAFHYLLL
jgi:hypothetical protein